MLLRGRLVERNGGPLTVLQRPSITPLIECRSQIQAIKPVITENQITLPTTFVRSISLLSRIRSMDRASWFSHPHEGSFFTGRPAFALSSLDRLALCGNRRRLLLSLALAFQVPFSDNPASPTEPAIYPTAYGKGTSVVYRIIDFLGMSAEGLVCENVAMAMGNPVSTPCSSFSFLYSHIIEVDLYSTECVALSSFEYCMEKKAKIKQGDDDEVN